MFQAKTWLDKVRLEEIKVQYKFKGLIEVSRISRGGGVAIFWKEECNFSIDMYSSNHIDGGPDTRNRHKSWAKLRRLKTNSPFHGCVQGTLMKF